MRRLPKGNVAFVHDLLVFLEYQGFPFVPRFLGMDEQGREILSYLEGEIWPDSGSGLSDDLLEQTARAIRLYHVMMPRLDRHWHKALRLLPITNWDHTTPFSMVGTWWASSTGMMQPLARGYVIWQTLSTIMWM